MSFYSKYLKFSNKPWRCSSQIQGVHSGCAKPPVDIKTKVCFRIKPVYYNRTFVLMSMGGLAQPEWSPCTRSTYPAEPTRAVPHSDSTDRRGRRHPRVPLLGVEQGVRCGHNRADPSGISAATEAVECTHQAAVVGLDSGRTRRLLRHPLPGQDIRRTV